MCGICGCGGTAEIADGPVHHHGGQARADGTRSTRSHDHGDGHNHRDHREHGHMYDREPPDHEPRRDSDHRHGAGSVVELESRILAKNAALAARTRAWLAGREILAVNLVSSPGAGKTTLLERTIRGLGGELSIAVLEADQATNLDGERIRAAGAPAVQLNTGTGCHLDADMVERGLRELRPRAGSVVLIENIGNLVCPARVDLGERAKIVVLSVTEGDDKPLKYPHMFAAASLLIVNKIDLLPHVDFSVDRAVAHARAVNPDIDVLWLSARCGKGLDGWYDWLRRESAAVREPAFA